MPKNLEERFWEKVNKDGPDECWLWTANAHPIGYGKFSIGQKTVYAHRVSYALAHGLALESMTLHIRHACDNPRCVNPEHLSLGTAQDNADDRVKRGRSLRGSKHNLTHLTEADIKDIRQSTERGIDLAAKYGVAKSTISSIKSYRNWKHMPDADR